MWGFLSFSLELFPNFATAMRRRMCGGSLAAAAVTTGTARQDNHR